MAATLGAAVLDLGADVNALKRDMGKAESTTRSVLSSIQNSIRNVFEIALGNIVARGLATITDGIRNLGRQAIDAVGNAQRLEMSLRGMLTESLMYEQVSTSKSVYIELTGEEQRELEKLNLERQIAEGQLGKLSEAMADAGEASAQQSLQALNLQDKIAGLDAEIATLAGRNGTYATSTETSTQQVRTFAEAQEEAKKQVRDMLDYVEKLSILSPFEQSEVETITKIAIGARMGTEQVKDFTQAFLDYAAAHGIASADLSFAAEQFLQLKQSGKLLSIDLRQLRRLGIDVSRILSAKMGMSVEEFNSKVEQSPELMDQLFESFVEMANETSSGAAAEMATSVDGMMSTAGDIIEIGSRKLFRPIVEAMSPTILSAINKVSDIVTGPKMAEIGERIGGALQNGIQGVRSLLKGDDLVGFVSLATAAQDLFGPNIGVQVLNFRDRFVELKDQAIEFAGVIREQAGMAIEWFTTNVLPKLRTGLAWLKENWKPIVAGISAFVATLLSSGAVAGVIAGIVAVVTTLASPIMLIAGAVGLLATAWTQNWGGIQQTAAAMWAQLQPALQQLAAWLQVNLPIAIQALSTFWTTTLQPILQQLWTWFSTNLPTAIAALVSFWNGTLKPAFQDFGNFLTTVWWPLLQKIGQAFITFFVNGGQRLGALWAGLQAVGSYVAGAFSSAWQTAVAVWQSVLPIFQAVGAFFETYILPLLSQLAGLVKDGIGFAAMVVAGIWQNVLLPALQTAGAWIAETLGPVIQNLTDFIQGGLQVASEALAAIWNDTIKPALTTVATIVAGSLLLALTGLADWLNDAGKKVFGWLSDTALPAIKTGFEGIKDAIQWVIDKIAALREKLNSVKDSLPWWMTPGSPTPMENGLWGIGRALDEVAGKRLPQLKTNLAVGLNMPSVSALSGLSVAGAGALSAPSAEYTLTFGDVTINDGSDITDLARKVVREIQRHERR